MFKNTFILRRPRVANFADITKNSTKFTKTTYVDSRIKRSKIYALKWWRCGVVAITTAQLHSTKPELRFCAGSNPACGVSEIRDGEDL